MSGKGSDRRPGKGYEDNFSRIFGERPKRQPYTPPVDGAQDSEQDEDSTNPLGDTMCEGIGGA